MRRHLELVNDRAVDVERGQYWDGVVGEEWLKGPRYRPDMLPRHHGEDTQVESSEVGLDGSKLKERSPEHGIRHATQNTLLISCDWQSDPACDQLSQPLSEVRKSY